MAGVGFCASHRRGAGQSVGLGEGFGGLLCWDQCSVDDAAPECKVSAVGWAGRVGRSGEGHLVLAPV